MRSVKTALVNPSNQSLAREAFKAGIKAHGKPVSAQDAWNFIRDSHGGKLQDAMPSAFRKRYIMEFEAWKLRTRGKKNPESDSAAAFESFHGEPSGETVIIEDKIHEHEYLWVCGRLIEICVNTLTGRYLYLSWEDREEADTPYLCCSEDGTQLYIEGGDQELDLKAIGMDGDRWVKDRMVIGEFSPKEKGRACNITYRTKKDFDNFEEIDYQHELGESSKELRHPVAPFLEYEPRNKKLYITGGQYIINKPLFGTSPGIEN